MESNIALSLAIIFTGVIIVFLSTGFISYQLTDKGDKMDPLPIFCITMILTCLAGLFTLGGVIIIGKIWLIIYGLAFILASIKYLKDLIR